MRYLPKPEYRFEVVPEEAEWIPKMAAMCIAGDSLYRIAQTLNAHDVRTVTGKARWGVTSVKSVLSNPLYTGVYYWGKRTYVEPSRRFKDDVLVEKTKAVWKDPSEWYSISGTVTVNGEETDVVPRVLSPETYEAVQAALTRNGERSRRNMKREYLLRGIAYCLVCGRRLVGHASGTGRGRAGKRYYWCHNGQGRPQDDPSARCTVRDIPADALEAVVWAEVIRQVSDEAVILRTLQERNEQADEVLEGLHARLATEDKELARLKREKSLLFDLLRDGDIDRDIYNDKLFLLRKDEATVMKVRAGIEAEIRSHEHAHADVEDIRQLVALAKRGLTLVDFEAKREFLEALEVKVLADKHTVRISGLLQEAVLSMMAGDMSSTPGVCPDDTLKHTVV